MRRLRVVRVEGGQVGEGASEHQHLDQVLVVFEVLQGGHFKSMSFFWPIFSLQAIFVQNMYSPESPDSRDSSKFSSKVIEMQSLESSLQYLNRLPEEQDSGRHACQHVEGVERT